jgi:hypothetical protein
MPRPLDRLTDRELEVLELIGHGHTARQIAATLKLGIPMGSEISHQGPCPLLAPVSRAVHAHDVHPPDERSGTQAHTSQDRQERTKYLTISQ